MQLNPEHAAPPAPLTATLNDGQRLVLRLRRRWTMALLHGAEPQLRLLWHELECEFDQTGARQVFCALVGLCRALQGHARRPLVCCAPCWNAVGADELSVLSLLSCCQGGRWVEARLHAEWLVRQDGLADLLDAGARLATLLRAHGHWLAPAQDVA